MCDCDCLSLRSALLHVDDASDHEWELVKKG